MKASNNRTLVIESKQDFAIENAHHRATELFAQISKIESARGTYSFVVMPDNQGNLSEHLLLENVAQQVFIDWCEGQNNHAGCSLYSIRQVEY